MEGESSFLHNVNYNGIRVSDGLQLKWSNLKGNRLTYIISKTGLERKINLIPQAKQIAYIYNSENKKQDNYIFPFLSNTEVFLTKRN